MDDFYPGFPPHSSATRRTDPRNSHPGDAVRPARPLPQARTAARPGYLGHRPRNGHHVFRRNVSKASITLGSLAPTIVHARTVETYLEGKALSEEVCREAGQLALRDASPIGDVRGSATYRQATLARLVTLGLERIANGKEAEGWMAEPILLDSNGKGPRRPGRPARSSGAAIQRHHFDAHQRQSIRIGRRCAAQNALERAAGRRAV